MRTRESLIHVQGSRLSGLQNNSSGDTSRDWSAETSSTEDEEDYDDLNLDDKTLVKDSQGGGVEDISNINALSRTTDATSDSDHTCSEIEIDSKGMTNFETIGRRKSVQVIFEPTTKKDRYTIKADDPEVREILRRGIEREHTLEGKERRTRFRDLVFTRQFTTFDRKNPSNAGSPFHGFFTLFWLAMGLLLLRVAAQNWREHGSILGSNEIMKMMFKRDVVVLGLTDGVMCASTAFGLLLQKTILKGYLKWETSGWIIQNAWQTLYLGAVLGWTLYRNWPWTHTVFIVLHCLVFIMKQHSYAFYNGYLSQVYRRRSLLQGKLEQLNIITPITSPTSSERRKLSSPTSALDQLDQNTAHRRQSTGPKSSTNLKNERSEISTIAASIESGSSLDADQLSTFSSIIRQEISALDAELMGKCTNKPSAYPANLTLANSADYICLPTLVYELEYPRQEHINWWYVAEKSAATFGVLWVMMIVSQAYIYPPVAETVRMKEAGMPLAQRWREFPWIVSDMLFPLLIEQLLSWYVIWECILNVLAELTKFADRGFYGDWWNSVSWDQYARDWNRPVHAFLLRHVYHSSISAFHISKRTATFATFLLSACVHELVMWCLFRKVRGYLFLSQLSQLPLAMLSRTKLLKGRDVLGNVVFWLGLFVGPSIITSLYLIM